MIKHRYREHFRQRLLDLFLRLLKTEESRRYLNLHADDHGAIRRRVSNVATPYKTGIGGGSVSEAMEARTPVFVTGRFRSGSTLLWNIFRSLDDCTAYYEPLNERRWFLRDGRGQHTDATHQGVTEYWAEYEGLDHLAKYYREDWIRHRLYMDERDFDYNMKSYIDALVSHAGGRPVLQFNRVDFRLAWLRANYPDSPIIHIYRNPRDQWCSSLGDITAYSFSARSEQTFPRRFYQGMWVRDLCRQFPFLEDYRDRHQYYNFYFLWKLSYNFGQHYSDISISMETLTGNPVICTDNLLSAVGWSAPDHPLDLSFVKPAVSRWRDYAGEEWFANIEAECEAVLEDFLK